MIVEFLSCAEQEFAEAVAWYNEQNPGLGFDFAAEIKRAISRVEQHPEAWTLLSPRTRRIRVSRFPYSLVYQVRGECLLIVAVMHMNRHPQIWEERI
ncbi:MAG: type II toxin-antitoxin system RelE/ParE family toxin [Desulfovibrio sp.]|nr:MAG: type II toxin-antitoxin system RelE/ParE family toxin [Desulfovibrio sp.]